MGTPKNFNGTQPADFGAGYAGLYLFAPDDYREYLQSELIQPLVKGQTYKVSFYVSLAERSDYAVKEFGLLFSKDKIQVLGKKELSVKKRLEQKDNEYHYQEIGYTNFFVDTKDWVLVYLQFEANGGERYMTLGNFKNNARTRFFKIKGKEKRGAYYYVDMVMVEPVGTIGNNADSTTEAIVQHNYELGKAHIFNSLLFRFDSDVLGDAAKAEIRRLYQHLKHNGSLQVQIGGHTDNIGPDAYNTALSSARAQAVAGYLHKLGIAKNRIEWQGYGGSRPLASNGDESGRRLNRRVEFIITQETP